MYQANKKQQSGTKCPRNSSLKMFGFHLNSLLHVSDCENMFRQRPISLSALPYPSHPSNIQYCLNFLPPSALGNLNLQKKDTFGQSQLLDITIFENCLGKVKKLKSNQFKYWFCKIAIPSLESLKNAENSNKSFRADSV